jgi:hypothetical protein
MIEVWIEMIRVYRTRQDMDTLAANLSSKKTSDKRSKILVTQKVQKINNRRCGENGMNSPHGAYAASPASRSRDNGKDDTESSFCGFSLSSCGNESDKCF